MSYRRRAGTATVTTIQVRHKTAKCPANQEALDRLHERRIKAEQNPNSNYVFTIKRAMDSLAACPHPIDTLQKATKLKYVGATIAKLIVPHSAPPPSVLTTRVPTTMTAAAAVAAVASSSTSEFTIEDTTKRKTTRQTTLTGSSSSISLSLSTVQPQPHPQSQPQPQSQPGPTPKEHAYRKAKAHAERLTLPAGPWKVILLVDIRERNSKQVVARCKQSGIPCEERTLPIGDMAWIARCSGKDDNDNLEVLVGTIVERKEVADLSSSLFGTRFLEQRLRLQHCGLPQILYLVEGDLNNVKNCPAATMRMAMMETRVQMGFSVLQTRHMEDTVRLLKGLHRRVVQRTFPLHVDDHLPAAAGTQCRKRGRERRASSLLELIFDAPPVPPFASDRFTTYTELKTKVEWDREAGTKTVGAIYTAMLKQVATLSQKKCIAIRAEYPTLCDLMRAYANTPPHENPATLVKDIACDRQKVGPKSAAELHIVCATRRDGTLATSAMTGHPTTALKSTSRRRVPSTSANTTATTTTTASSAISRGLLDERNQKLSFQSRSTNVPAVPASTMANSSALCMDLTADTPPRHATAGIIKRQKTQYQSSQQPSWAASDDEEPELNDDAYFAKLYSSSSSGSSSGGGGQGSPPLPLSAAAVATKATNHKDDEAELDEEASLQLLVAANTTTTTQPNISAWTTSTESRPPSKASTTRRTVTLELDSESDEGERSMPKVAISKEKPSPVQFSTEDSGENSAPPPVGVDVARPPPPLRESMGGYSTTTSGPLFSSPSTFGSGDGGLQSSQEGFDTVSTQKKKNKNEKASYRQDVSIVVIDSSSSDEEDDEASQKLDLRSRLDKRLDRETIEID